MTQVQAKILYDFADRPPSLELLGVDVGPYGDVYLLMVDGQRQTRDETSGGSFALVESPQPVDYLVCRIADGRIAQRWTIASQRLNVHAVQPLPDDQLALVCHRCRRFADGRSDQNALIVDASGEITNRIVLGDGIAHVQATPGGALWVGYFDEGVYGNYGWDDPIGADGLIRWDSAGAPQFRFEARQGLDPISDCYALNAIDDRWAWLCYYTDFPLVELRPDGKLRYWDAPVSGATAFAVCGERVLFGPGYTDGPCQLVQLKGRGARIVEAIEVLDPDGDLLARPVAGRGSLLYWQSAGAILSVDLASLG